MKTPPVPPQAATQPAPRLVASTAGGLFIFLALLAGCQVHGHMHYHGATSEPTAVVTVEPDEPGVVVETDK